MRVLLEQMYLTSSAWAPESSPVCATDLRENARRVPDKPLLHMHVDQYLKVLGIIFYFYLYLS